MGFGMNKEAWILTAILCPLLILINVLRAGKPANLVHYPQIRAKEWTPATFAGSSIGWVIYLLGYEICFRGILLFGCVEVMGVWPAIAINASIYSFAHFFKGIGETVGAIPFGIIISLISLWTGNFMVAFLVHCSLALSNQTVAFLAHPDMKWKKA
jgi:membrane protease YdiL (CAAX protease family)